MKAFFGSVLVAVAASTASATIIMQDNFDSYANQAAFIAAWPTSTSPNNLQLSGASFNSPSQSVFSSGDLARRSRRSLPAAQVGTVANPLVVEFWMDVPTVNGNARQYSQIESYAGDACATGALDEIFAMGIYNQAPTTPGFFNARAAFSGVATTGGWFNLTVPRTAGWHRFTMEFIGNTVNYYVDGTLGGSVTDTAGGGINDLDCFALGSGQTSNPGAAPQNAYFDDVKVEVTPEPSSLALLGLGALGLMRRRR